MHSKPSNSTASWSSLHHRPELPSRGDRGESAEQFSLWIPPAPTSTCSASELQASVIPPTTSEDFSFTYLQLTDVSSQPCHMERFPGFDLVDASGSSLVDASRGCTTSVAGECPTTPVYVSLSARRVKPPLSWYGRRRRSLPRRPESASALVTPRMPSTISRCHSRLQSGDSP